VDRLGAGQAWRVSGETEMSRILVSIFERLVRRGSLEIAFHNGQVVTVGDGSPATLRMRLVDRRAPVRLVLNPQLAFGELYTDGRLRVEGGDICDLLTLLMSNLYATAIPRHAKFIDVLRRLFRRVTQYNAEGRARRNVAHHYDLDKRLYALFLDADRQYSCAYFEHPMQSLDEAQLAKKRHIAAKLIVEPGHRVLDIGSGWGGLALYLAEHCGAQVTGITLSEEQFAVARTRASERRLDKAIDFRLQDYRTVPERFDRIVSVGMFEHVGVGFYQTFFDTVARLLNDDGVMLLHAIGRVEGAGVTNPWMAKYIFPGGYIPGLSEVIPRIEKAGLVITDVEILRLHYAETLKAWRQRFTARREEVLALFDERFYRMWDFYLAGMEAAFRHDGIMVFQIQVSKRLDTVPLTRDYIGDRENALRTSEGRRDALRLAGE
jgi:cyclopropane-fatty-acyl-phospholipid synthase